MKRGLISIVILSLLVSGSPVSAIPVVPVKVEVGLDNGTIALLDRLPGNLRDAFVAAVTKSLDRLDFSVANYIKDIQAAASQTVQDVACTSDGLIQNVGSDLGKGLTTLLIGDSTLFGRSDGFATPPSVDASSQALDKTIADTRLTMRADTSSSTLFAIYSDLSFESAKLICKDRARNAPPDFAIDRLQLMRRALGEWRILSEIDKCANPDACLLKRQQDIKQIIAREPQDLIDEAGVRGEIDQSGPSKPTAPPPTSGWRDFFKLGILANSQPNNYDIGRTEEILLTLRDVELKVAALKSKRQERAIENWTAAKKLLDPVPNFFAGIAGEMDRNSGGYNIVIDSEHAFNNLGSAKKSIVQAKQLVQSANSLDPRLTKPAADALAEIKSYEDDGAKKVEQICSIYLDTKMGGRLRMRTLFNSDYGAFKWCSGNPKNRWALFPTPK
jgi:hypothetical protein